MSDVKKQHPIMGVTIFAGIAVLLLALSYCQELPKHAFEREAAAIDARPGTRLIDTMKTGDLASPITWIRPNQTMWRYAVPDPVQTDRFAVMAFHFEHEPSAYMIDADCPERRLYYAGLDEPEDAVPMRDVFGRSVSSGDGRIFRMVENAPEPDPKLLAAFCNTDWTLERSELRTAQGN
ncbi:hypothetical protein [Brevundimonas sp.]|uniref:hypothetical protein n=1 Tax=Brevundimonas sp. TaxID=1871086 RepID=UPI00356B4C6A